jgi:hypothetical protein
VSAPTSPAQNNPLADILLVAGAALCLGAIGYDDAEQLTSFPGTMVLVAGILTGLCALTALAEASPYSEPVAVLLGAVLFGYMAHDVVPALKYLSESGTDFEGAILVATFGCVALLIGVLASFVPSGPPREATPGEPRRQGTTPATSTRARAAAAAPAGWYPDPGGGPGQRYWDGEQWGQASG